MKKFKIYLDDTRTPIDNEWIVVRNYDDFVNKVKEIGIEFIDTISLDHDLGDSAITEYINNVKPNYSLDYKNIKEKTGLDCAKWLIYHYVTKYDNDKFVFPNVYTHSSNPIGSANIIGYVNNFLKNKRQQQSCVRVRIEHTHYMKNKTSIDNLELIKPLLNFDNENDFYMLYIFKRKKDQVTDKSNHQSVRTIKSYCVSSIDYLEEKYDEIKQLCEIFNARAYIHIQKQNHKDVALNMISEIANRVQNGHYNQNHVFDSIVGQIKTYEKRWIIDIDTKDKNELLEICDWINNHCPPFNDGEDNSKIIKMIPTKNGIHLITEKFDLSKFKEKYLDIDVQKKNPTLLYYPESLN